MSWSHLAIIRLRLLWLSSFLNFFTLYFIDYAITVVLIFPPLSPSTQHPQLPQAIPPPLLCPWVMCIRSLAALFPILYFTSPWLFCNYLLILLTPLTSSPIPPHPPPFWQPSKCSLYPWFCLCSSCLLSLLFRSNCWEICIFAILCS